MATLRGPGAPVTRAPAVVIIAASLLPAAKASIEGAYANQSNLTSTPASLNQPFWMPISKAVHPGQSEKPTRSGGLLSAGGSAARPGPGDASALRERPAAINVRRKVRVTADDRISRT